MLMFIAAVIRTGSCGDNSKPAGPEDSDSDLSPGGERITTSYESSDTNFLPGEVHRKLVEGISLDKDTYTAIPGNSDEVPYAGIMISPKGSPYFYNGKASGIMGGDFIQGFYG